jgi:hypothetical protein
MVADMNGRLRRTQKGRDEVLKKTHILTQSERLLLVVADGITTTEGLQWKLRGLSKRRFKLAIADLTAKGLLEEYIPSENQSLEKLDVSIIEQFVRQDPLDPITITALRLKPDSSVRAVKSSVVPEPEHKVISTISTDSALNPLTEVDFYLPLEVQVDLPVAPDWRPDSSISNIITANGAEEDNGSSIRRMKRQKRGRRVQIGYWLLFAGLICLIVSIAITKFH